VGRFITLSVAMMALFTGCVKDPGKFRHENPVVVGFPGLMYHTSKSNAFGIQLDELQKADLTIKTGGEGEKSFSINPDPSNDDEYRRMHYRGWGADLFVMRFPWDQASVFYGFNVNYRDDRVAFNERTTNFSLDKSMANVEFSERAVSFSPMVGASKSMTTGTTFMAGAGPRIYKFGSREFVSDGGDAIDKEMRDDTLASYDEYLGQWSWEFLAIVGQAF
jgi:hypothetical protein